MCSSHLIYIAFIREIDQVASKLTILVPPLTLFHSVRLQCKFSDHSNGYRSLFDEEKNKKSSCMLHVLFLDEVLVSNRVGITTRKLSK